MMRAISILVVTMALATMAAAAKEQTLEGLIAHADAASVKDQPGLYIEILERELKVADESYGAGKVEDARRSVAAIVTYSEKAHDAAIQSGKKMKNVEMAERKISHKLVDLKRTLNFDDQPPVQAAADRLESLADDLLAHMFGKQK
jgi:hypothetical protein